MKEQIRLLGIDDGPFHFTDQKTILIGTVMRANGYLEGVLKRDILIDGSEATQVLIEMIHSTVHCKQLKAMLIDGGTVAGFNIIDIEEVFKESQIPVITITRDPPNFDNIKKALQAHFKDWNTRFNLLKKGELFEMKTKYNPIYFKSIGLSVNKAKEIITLSTIRGVIPEPIRVAHLIASGVMRGESYGKS